MRIIWTAHGTDAWMALNHSMYQALRLAIGANLAWDVKAIVEIQNTMRPGYWIGENGWEHAYAFAIAVDNRSFIKSYEEHIGRPSFFANDVTTIDACGFVHTSNGCHLKRGRIAIGSSIGDSRHRITSVTQDSVTLCTYEGDDPVPKKREKLTLEMMMVRYPAPKKAKQVESNEPV